MKKDSKITVTVEARARLEAIVAAPSMKQKYVWRARIVLLSAAGVGTMAIVRQVGKSKRAVWRWRERFVAEGVDGLRDRSSRPLSSPSQIPLATADAVENLRRERRTQEHRTERNRTDSFPAVV